MNLTNTMNQNPSTEHVQFISEMLPSANVVTLNPGHFWQVD